MAKLDEVTIKGKKHPCFNLTESVGPGGRNKRSDVAVIQAYLKYISTFDQMMAHGEAVPEPPPIDGQYTYKTGEAILTYQRWASFRVLNADGKIEPASYAGRNIKNPHKPLMTITFLHIHAKNAARFYAHEYYVEGMIRSYPIILPMIALDLARGRSLMSSIMNAPGIGSLFD